TDPGDVVFRNIEKEATKLRAGIEAVQATIKARLSELTEQSRKHVARPKPATPPKQGKGKTAAEKAEHERDRRRDTLHSYDSLLWRLRGTVDAILHYLGSADVAAAISGSVLLVGEAGCGKSHLVADV